MTSPLVPELPQLPEFPGGTPSEARPARAFEPAATGVLLLLLALTLVLAVLVRAVPAGPLVTVALLLLTAVGVLAVTAPEAGALLPATSPEGLGDDEPEPPGAYYYDRQGRPVPIDDAF